MVGSRPSYGTARHWYALGFVVLDEPELGLEEMRKGVESDPLSLIIQTEYGMFLVRAGYPELAEKVVRDALELDPEFGHGYLRLGWVLEYAGRYAEAVPAYERAQELGVRYGFGQLGHAYARAGRTDDAREVLARLEELSTKEYVVPTQVAYVHAGLGELDPCFAWLEKAYEERTSDLLLLRFRFGHDLGGDPRFAELLSRMGLRE